MEAAERQKSSHRKPQNQDAKSVKGKKWVYEHIYS